MTKALDDIIAAPPDLETRVDPRSWFDSPGPFELEIGCGKGGFLLSRARCRPDVRLLGIEWANKYFKYAADRMARWQLDNVRVMRTDARIFVMNHLVESCIDVLHIYHPDPWPKARHHKRRLIQPDFVAVAVICMVPGARLMFQSDHQEYFEEAVEILDGHESLARIDWLSADAQAGPDWKGTNFEVKYTAEGRSIYRQAYARSGDR
ncbi:MAG: tRNA (guanine(46)-N(7))-methyltransferase TrmB [Planctomycetota bacterium]|jgi:tRNA (guanine-N7-)-methyltransferase